MRDLFKEARYHKSLDGVVLSELRERSGLTQAEFASLCEWSQQYQQQLEIPEIHEVRIKIVNSIENAFKKIGVGNEEVSSNT